MVTPSSTTRHPTSRGQSRRAGRGARADRDGDLTMDTTSKNRGRIGKKEQTTKAPGSRPRDSASRGRGGLNSNNLQRAIARQAAGGDVSMKETTSNTRSSGLVRLKVTGYEKSKAANSKDNGVASLIRWLEKKASLRLGSRGREVKIKKSKVEDDNVLIISVPEADVRALERMNGFVWAQATITIQRVGGAVQDDQPPSQKEQTMAMLRSVLERRYNAESKLLDLSALGLDPELKAQAVFNTESTAGKFFPAMMRVLELAFDKPEDLNDAIESVSLANNDLTDLKAVSSLSATVPKLHNLDISNNKFADLNALSSWRRRFYNLQHLIVTNNPLEQSEPNFAVEFMKWYSNLRMLNNIQVRTEEDIARKTDVGHIPFPIKSAQFHDEGGIAEHFIRNWFMGFDTDRNGLAHAYYDDQSNFSYAINTRAPRDPASSEQIERQEWDQYIRHSRNLKKINQLPARQNRCFRGAKAVADAFAAMPNTKHPDLATEARKWMIEAHMQPGIPDPTGQAPGGVDGFSIHIHTEFDEVDSSTGAPKKKRSCDHVFQVGPGGPTGVRIVSHQITIRAYGGAQAFEPENVEHGPVCGVPSPPQVPVNLDPPQLPPHVSLEMAEQMVMEFSKQTNMTIAYSKDCLQQVNWDFQKGLGAFETVKANLPPHAFTQGA